VNVEGKTMNLDLVFLAIVIAASGIVAIALWDVKKIN
jgi:hypothetical protein